MSSNSLAFMKLAVELAEQSTAEDAGPHPRVGAVIVRGGKVLATGCRTSIDGAGLHAEYIALEKANPTASFAGATVYTTLEPCTSRNHPKVPCAVRLAEHKVAKVVIGMLDPNPAISGKGVHLLRERGIKVEFFPNGLMARIEELNRDFTRHFSHAAPVAAVQDEASRIRFLGAKREASPVLDELVLHAKSRIDLLGLSLHDFFSGEVTPETLLTKVREGCWIRLFALDPRSEIVDFRARDEGLSPRTLRERIFEPAEVNWQRLSQLLADSAPDHRTMPGRLELLRYSSLPYFNVLRVDETLVFGVYNRNRACNTSAAFQVQRGHPLFAQFEQDLDYLMASTQMIREKTIEFRGGSGSIFNSVFSR